MPEALGGQVTSRFELVTASSAIIAPEGGIQGVRSSSSKKPLKIAGFREDQIRFATASSYRQWDFSYAPTAVKPPAR